MYLAKVPQRFAKPPHCKVRRTPSIVRLHQDPGTIQGSGCGGQETVVRIQRSGYGGQDLGKVQGSGYGGQETVVRIQWSGYGGQDTVVRIQQSGYGGQDTVVRIRWSGYSG